MKARPSLVKCRLNAVRRWIVCRLLGDDLVLEQQITETGTQFQLVDMRRRIPFGYWNAERISQRDFRLSWCPHEKL